MSRRSRKRSKAVNKLSLLDLGDDSLRKVFANLPDLKAVKLVCKRFHQIATSMLSGSEWIRIRDEEDIDDELLYQSMMKTERVIRNAAIGKSRHIKAVQFEEISDDFLCDPWYFSATLSVIGIRLGENIQHLQLMNVKIPMGSLADLISFSENLKSLSLYFVQQDNKKTPEVVRKYEDEPLPKIRDLVIYECDDSVLRMLFSHIPINSLLSLTIKTQSFELLEASLSKQKTVRKLNLISESHAALSESLFEQLSLTHLVLKLKMIDNLTEIIARNQDLNSLDVGDMPVNDSAFQSIVQLPRLEKLSIDCSHISCAAFSSLQRLKALQFLSITSHSPEHFEVAYSLLSSIFQNNLELKLLDEAIA